MPADANIRQRLEAKAFELGFDQFGITKAATSEQIVAGFRKFVELKRYASMEWMAYFGTIEARKGKSIWLRSRNSRRAR